MDWRRPKAQTASRWIRTTWTAFLPAHADLLSGLPDRISRNDVIERITDVAEDEAAAVDGSVTAMVWGYGTAGYGAFHTARVLSDNPATMRHSPSAMWYDELLTRSGLLPPEDVQRWQAIQTHPDQDGSFFAASSYYTYLAQRPT